MSLLLTLVVAIGLVSIVRGAAVESADPRLRGSVCGDPHVLLKDGDGTLFCFDISHDVTPQPINILRQGDDLVILGTMSACGEDKLCMTEVSIKSGDYFMVARLNGISYTTAANPGASEHITWLPEEAEISHGPITIKKVQLPAGAAPLLNIYLGDGVKVGLQNFHNSEINLRFLALYLHDVSGVDMNTVTGTLGYLLPFNFVLHQDEGEIQFNGGRPLSNTPVFDARRFNPVSREWIDCHYSNDTELTRSASSE